MGCLTDTAWDFSDATFDLSYVDGTVRIALRSDGSIRLWNSDGGLTSCWSSIPLPSAGAYVGQVLFLKQTLFIAGLEQLLSSSSFATKSYLLEWNATNASWYNHAESVVEDLLRTRV